MSVLNAFRYKTHNTPSELGNLTDEQLRVMGVESKEDRKIALAAFKKAGYKPAVRDPVGANAVAGPSKLSSVSHWMFASLLGL